MGFGNIMKGLFTGVANTKQGKQFLQGTPESSYQQSLLTPAQQKLQKEQINAAKGGFGDVANYYRSNLSDNPADFQAFAAPEMRQFNEQIIPGLSEQFAGMGAGNLSSSGFRNAAVGAGADLSERLGVLRANLRQNSAAGLQNLAKGALTPTSENIIRPGTPGLLDNIGPAAVAAVQGYFAGGPAGAAAAGGSTLLSGGQKGSTSPYGGPKSSQGGTGFGPKYNYNPNMRG